MTKNFNDIPNELVESKDQYFHEVREFWKSTGLLTQNTHKKKEMEYPLAEGDYSCHLLS